MGPIKENLIVGRGTPYADWIHSKRLSAAPEIRPESLLIHKDRLVIVSPHPDDEILSCGGLLQTALTLNLPFLLISVTDGSACYPNSSQWSEKKLGHIRLEETQNALERLGWKKDHYQWIKAGFPDTQVQDHEKELELLLSEYIQPSDVVFTTWALDGHNDHDATGRATKHVCDIRNAVCYENPIWAWHWATVDDDRIAWDRLKKITLSKGILQKKLTALEAFISQFAGDKAAGLSPILTDNTLARFQSPFEIVFV